MEAIEITKKTFLPENWVPFLHLVKRELGYRKWSEVASALQIPTQTLYGWLHKGKTPRNKRRFVRNLNRALLVATSGCTAVTTLLASGMFDELHDIVHSTLRSKNGWVIHRLCILLVARLAELVECNWPRAIISIHSKGNFITPEAELRIYIPGITDCCYGFKIYKPDMRDCLNVAFTVENNGTVAYTRHMRLSDKNVEKLYKEFYKAVTNEQRSSK